MTTAAELNKLKVDLRATILETIDDNMRRIRNIPVFPGFDRNNEILKFSESFQFPSSYDCDIFVTISGITVDGKEIEMIVDDYSPDTVSIEKLEDDKLLFVVEQLENIKTMADVKFAE